MCFIFRQLREKFLADKIDLYLTFLDLVNAFDGARREGCYLMGFKETRCGGVIGKNCTANVWNAPSWVGFLVSMGLNQCSTLKLLPILLLETFKKKMRSTCQEEFLYADGLALVNKSLEGFIPKPRSVAKH